MNATCLCSGRDVASAVSLYRDQLAVSLREDGLVIYNTQTQEAIKTWTLGISGHQVCSTPAYDPQTQAFHLAARSASNGSSAHDVLLSWPRKSEVGSLKQVARRAEVQASVHSLHPLLRSANIQQDGSNAMDVDARASLLAVCSNGTVAACSQTEGVLAENVELCGNEPLAAAIVEQELIVVHRSRSTGWASRSSFTHQDNKVCCGSITQLAPAHSSTGCSVVAAVPTSTGASAVFWSDGTLAVYQPNGPATSSNSADPVQPEICRRLRGFEIPQQQQQGANPLNGKLGGKGSKKRGHTAAASIHSSGGSIRTDISLAALPHGLIAIAGWSTDAAGGAAVRLVILDTLYGCIQSTLELSSSSVAGAVFNPGSQVQAVPVGSNGEQLAVVAGSSVLLVDLQLQAPTLANLLGALCMDRLVTQGAGKLASSSAAAAAASLAAPEAQELLPGASRFAASAAAALHESELDQLVGPGGGLPSAPAPVEFSLEAAQLAEGDSSPVQLLARATVRWREPAGSAMQQAERSAWELLLEGAPGAKENGQALDDAARKLVQASQQQAVAISLRLLAKMLQEAAGRQLWGCVGELLAAQHPGSLASCPGLVLCLTEAHQYRLLQQLLCQATEVPADELAAVLKCLLRSRVSTEVLQAQREYYESAISAAEAAVAAAEAAARRDTSSQALLAVAACCAGAVEGLTPAQICLHPLLVMRHDSSILLDALRQLSATEALALLRYLHTLLSNFARLVGDHFLAGFSSGLPGAIVLPHPQSLLDWAGAALDANMTRLVLRREAGKVLDDMRKLIEGQLRSLRRLSQVKGAMQHMQCGASLPSPHPSSASKYTLEWLDLRVF